MDLFKTMYSMTIASVALLLIAVLGLASYSLEAAELNTQLPAANTSSGTLTPVNIDLPSQPLDASLKQLARTTGISVAFDSKLATGKTAPAVKGRMKADEALKMLLAGSGLESSIDKDSAVIKPAVEKQAIDFKVDAIEVRAKRFYEIGPLPGLGLTKEEIPGNVQSISAKEIKEAHSISMADLFNRKLQSVTVNDYQGNPFQMDVQYRGFTAGPQIGTPQGLSVFFDGIRVNEPFGDVVNWDMIPMNAIANVDVFPGSNPIFGLNTLGGAFTVKTKDGFNNPGVTADVLTGSYGRKQLQAEGGWNNGTVAAYGAANIFMEDGWRDNSPSKVNQVFGKGSYRGDKLDLNVSGLVVWNDLTGNGLLPSEMYRQDKNSVFSSPDTTDNRLWQGQLSGSYFVSDNFTITGQVYRRNSKRHQKGADVFTDYDPLRAARKIPANGEEATCVFKSTNGNGIPDYLLIPVNRSAGEDLLASDFLNDFINGNGDVDISTTGAYHDNFNAKLPDWYLTAYQNYFNAIKNPAESGTYNRDQAGTEVPQSGPTNPVTGEVSWTVGTTFTGDIGGGIQGEFIPGEKYNLVGGYDTFYYQEDDNGNQIKYHVIFQSPINAGVCGQDRGTTDYPGPYVLYENGQPRLIDGFAMGQPGYVNGTPTGIISDNQIDQVVDGASVQFNWNYEHHKFMVGASIDSADAKYRNSQQLGFLDAERNVFLAPELAHPQFGSALISVENNNFSGTNMTKSIYFSETWSPVKTWNFSISARYNETRAKNVMATRFGNAAYEVGDVVNYPNSYQTCTTDEECANTPRNYRTPDIKKSLQGEETEKFNYYSFNPSIGATWQAREDLNVFWNVAQGARTPSVIELGCALDKTPVGPSYIDSNGKPYQLPKSVFENRSCNLPTTLSGDPFLPQIRSTSYDIGIRGTFGQYGKWNLGAYQTDLRNDIYFIAVGNGRGFFDSIGDTRRRGLEAGISNRFNKLSVHLNYSLTDATFENDFSMFSNDNSSAATVDRLGIGVINVKPGDRMPGVALHNLNASISYDITDKWSLGLSAVAHSGSFVRGNENNEHEVGVARTANFFVPGVGAVSATRRPTSNPGKVAGYATFNLQSAYKLNSEWTASVLINNLFDKEYFTAGRLGRNPFSPSILGAIGPDGYNHNSGDWLSTNFISPGAPRGIWFSLRYEFQPD